MVRTSSLDNSIAKRLCQLFPSPWLEELARDTGMLQRHRKLDPVGMFWTLVLSFGIGQVADLDALAQPADPVDVGL